MASKRDDAEYCRLLDEICIDCGECHTQTGERYCTLKEVIKSLGPSARFLVQLKCIEKFKFEESEKVGYNIGWEKASMLWAESGMAAKFASAYEECPTWSFIALYRKIAPL